MAKTTADRGGREDKSGAGGCAGRPHDEANSSRPLASIRRKSGNGKSGCWRARRNCSGTVAAATPKEQDALVAELYEQIGRLQMELGWLKKKAVRLD